MVGQRRCALAPANRNGRNGRETLEIELAHRDEFMPTTRTSQYADGL
jgi:hypothetical protein